MQPRERELHLRLDAELAERYGYVNRVVPDEELDGETHRMARRLASFDKQAIAETKAFVDATTLPGDDELPPGLAAFVRSSSRPSTQARMAVLAAHGLGSDSDLERRLGELVTLARAAPTDGAAT
jgi:enoyl-CoA hydratase/carnithine racemase